MPGIMSCPAKTYYGSRFFALVNRLTDHFISLIYYGIIVAIINLVQVKINSSNLLLKLSMHTNWLKQIGAIKFLIAIGSLQGKYIWY
jgi:extradiol dioxygenase family protein